MSDQVLRLAVRGNPGVRLEVIFQDGDLLIVNKPAGMVTQPGKGHSTDSMLNGLFALDDGKMGKLLHNLGERRDFGLLHRLDRETSGLLVVAKSPNAYDQLRRDFEARKVDKEYTALTAGVPSPKQGVVQARLKEIEMRNEKARGSGAMIKKVVIHRQGQEAISAYRVLKATDGVNDFGPAAKVAVDIKTGRLHQIRAHMTFLGCRVFGDDLYGTELLKDAEYPHPPRLCLHAGKLGFKHPTTEKWVRFEAQLPGDLKAFAKRVGLENPNE